MAVSKRLRFEILRRDNHTCRYCGAKAPDVPLRVDHVMPEALGGETSPGNLVTACEPCNSGKSSIAPDQQTVADIDQDALRWGAAHRRVIEERREQAGAKIGLLDYFLDEWESHLTPFSTLADDWQETVWGFASRGLETFDIDDALRIASNAGHIPHADRWRYFCGICWNKLRDIENAVRKELTAHGA